MKGLKQTDKKPSIKEVTLMIDSKVLEPQLHSPKINLQKTLRLPLSSLSLNANIKPKDSILKTPTTLNLNSTIKKGGHSKSKSEDKKSHSIQRSKSLSNISQSPHTKSISFVSKQSNMKCFQKLIFKITDYFQKEKHSWKLHKLSYEIVMKILHQLHYIQYPTQKQIIENNLLQVLKKVYQFWLNLTSRSHATLKNLTYLLCIIQNIVVNLDYIESALTSFKKHVQKTRGQFMDPPQYILQYRFIGVPVFSDWNSHGDLIINKNSTWKIQQSFSQFKNNRLNYNQRNNEQIQIEKFSISQKSNQLALNKRQKIQSIIRNRQPNIQKITLQDILNFKEDIVSNPPLSARTYDENKQIQNKPPKRPRLKLHRKCEPFVQMLSQPKVIKIKSKQQLQFQRNKQECTFKPDINPLKINQSQSFLKIKNVVKTLQRMKNTRESKIQQIQFRETGWTNNNRRSKSKDKQDKINLPLSARREHKENIHKNNIQKKDKYNVQINKQSVISSIQSMSSLKDQYQQNRYLDRQYTPQQTNKQQLKQYKKQNKQVKTDIKIPLLFIDINIDETQKQRLVIYQQDNSIQLAASFAKKHNLSKQMQMKLKQLLDYQMNSILTKIQQQAEEQDIF